MQRAGAVAVLVPDAPPEGNAQCRLIGPGMLQLSDGLDGLQEANGFFVAAHDPNAAIRVETGRPLLQDQALKAPDGQVMREVSVETTYESVRVDPEDEVVSLEATRQEVDLAPTSPAPAVRMSESVLVLEARI